MFKEKEAKVRLIRKSVRIQNPISNFVNSIPDGMNFDPVKCVKETFSRAGYAYRMNFDPPARRHICSGDSQITCLK